MNRLWCLIDLAAEREHGGVCSRVLKIVCRQTWSTRQLMFDAEVLIDLNVNMKIFAPLLVVSTLISPLILLKSIRLIFCSVWRRWKWVGNENYFHSHALKLWWVNSPQLKTPCGSAPLRHIKQKITPDPATQANEPLLWRIYTRRLVWKIMTRKILLTIRKIY